MTCDAQILQKSLEPRDRLDAPISALRFDHPYTLKHHGDDMGDDFKELLTDRFGEYPDLPRADALTPVMVKILSRRTHRAYTDEPVGEELIALLLAVALSASSKSDFQQVSIIRLKDPHRRGKIAAHFPLMPWIGTSPVFLIFCADARRLERICTIRNHPRHNGDLEAFLNASVDAALAMQTFILAAESAGLGCCPISVIRNQMETVAHELVLPDGVFPVAGLCVGYPAGKGHVSMRLPPSITIHTDTYDDTALEAQIDAYDRRRAARHAVKREQQRNPKLFGYADFYGWSEDKARQAAEPEGASFGRHVKSHGFSFES
jgi:FMN reductase [NAD(P)H]